ncbi:TPA: hypothetical protein N2C61_002054 [Pseudomonas aeruginosa]|nr:hypothetical protein [Pseudomonas aeruginosa]
MTSPLDAARQWIEDESPSRDEIKQSVDNLCHLYAAPPVGMTHDGIYSAITFLMEQLGEQMEALVLPERKTSMAIDAGLLVDVDEPGVQPQLTECPGERRARFESLKQELKSPF